MGIKVEVAGDIDRENAHRITAEGAKYTVGTDRDGKGLWVDGKQVLGTGQFHLNVKNKAAKIRRWAQDHL